MKVHLHHLHFRHIPLPNGLNNKRVQAQKQRVSLPQKILVLRDQTAKAFRRSRAATDSCGVMQQITYRPSTNTTAEAGVPCLPLLSFPLLCLEKAWRGTDLGCRRSLLHSNPQHCIAAVPWESHLKWNSFGSSKPCLSTSLGIWTLSTLDLPPLCSSTIKHNIHWCFSRSFTEAMTPWILLAILYALHRRINCRFTISWKLTFWLLWLSLSNLWDFSHSRTAGLLWNTCLVLSKMWVYIHTHIIRIYKLYNCS